MGKFIFFKKAILLLVFALFQATSFAQDNSIKGRVYTFDSLAVMNAKIVVKSSKAEYFSDSLGNFVVSCLPQDKIRVKAAGFNTQSLKINSDNEFVKVNLKLINSSKSAEMAVGYGHMKEKDITAAISSLKNKNDDFSMYTDMYELISGRFSGVQVEGDEIIIRGRSSINMSNAALIVVDGQILNPGVLKTISPIDVRSIEIIKDGSAAIYGTRGANGVVIITTKKGGGLF